MNSSEMDDAVEIVIHFYQVSKEDAIKYYMDEINSYLSLKEKLKNHELRSSISLQR